MHIVGVILHNQTVLSQTKEFIMYSYAIDNVRQNRADRSAVICKRELKTKKKCQVLFVIFLYSH